jgi:cardiolipin synthase
MKRAGVNFSWFRTPRWYQAQRFNYRMHRRILVIDGATAFTGGFGIAEEWTGDAENSRRWRNTHLGIEGLARPGL